MNIRKLCLFSFLSVTSVLGADHHPEGKQYHPLQSSTKTNKCVDLPAQYQQSREWGSIVSPDEILPIVFDQDLQPSRVTQVFHSLLYKFQSVDFYPELTIELPKFAVGTESSDVCSKVIANLLYYCMEKGHRPVDKIPFSVVNDFFYSYKDLLKGIVYEGAQGKFECLGWINRGLRHVTNENSKDRILYLMIAEELILASLIPVEKRSTRWVDEVERQASL